MHPDQPLFSFYDGDGRLREHYRFAGFFKRVNYVASVLRDIGVRRGEPVLAVYPPGTEMSVGFFAAALVGAIPAPAPPPNQAFRQAGLLRLAHIARHAGARRVLTTRALAERLAGADDGIAAGLDWIATDEMVGELEDLPQTPSEILFLQYTSGSTGDPHGVCVTHANALHNAPIGLPDEHPVGVSWLPHFHDMGLLGYTVFGVARGGHAHCFAPLDFLRRPLTWLELIGRTRAGLTTAPNAAYEYCLRKDKVPDEALDGLDLSSLTAMINCAEPVRASTFERFRARFARCGLSVTAPAAAYGLAEHTLCVTTGGSRIVERAGEPGCPPRLFVSCGQPAPDIDVRIVSPESHAEVAQGEVGEIWVDSPSKAAGYWRDPAATRETFEAKLAGQASGRSYLRTGDLGFRDQGDLFVCGRLRDMVIVNGANVFPADLEAVAEARFPALAGRVVAFGSTANDQSGEDIVVAVEAGPGFPDLAAIGLAIRQGTGISVALVARVARGAIRRTSSGKVARRLCRQCWEDGSMAPLDILRVATEGDDAIDAMVERLAAHAAKAGIPNATLDALGLDSMALVDISLALETLLDASGLATRERIERAADLSLLQAMRVGDLKAALNLFRSGPEGADSIVELLDRMAELVRLDEQGCMRADAEMDLPKPVVGRPGPGIFVTGATGFLGSHLLKQLIENGEEDMAALVRAKDAEHARRRLALALREAGMPEAAVDEALRRQVRPLVGDLAKPRLGLSAADWDTIARSAGRVYHSGAEVDYVKRYAGLRPVNVLATRDLIALAGEGVAKVLHHVSTTFVFGWSAQEQIFEDETNAAMDDLDFGYSQSKWVAEQLVLRAMAKGLKAVIYRPALITASLDGRFVSRDVTARVLGYMIRHGVTVDCDNQVSFVPVDVIAQNIAAISAAPAPPPVLHMTADGHQSAADICRVVERRHGYRFRSMSLRAFVAHAHDHCGPDDALYPLISFLDRNADRILNMAVKRYDSQGYREARATVIDAVAHPDIEATVDAIVAFLAREGLIPPPPAARGRKRAAPADLQLTP